MIKLIGVDFTSAPRRAKPITVARGCRRPDGVQVHAVDALPSFDAFDALLAEPGPWVGAFDLPFGLPRPAVAELGWPLDWAALVEHCAAMTRPAFRAQLDAHREARAFGDRYVHRAVDRPAASHSPLKLVNPPVALMFLEGAPRLARAGVHVPGMRSGDTARVAVEAYPGYLVRSITRASYKSDTRARQTPERALARTRIVEALLRGEHCMSVRLHAPPAILAQAQADASGDTLDAIVCALQAGWAAQRAGHGVPPGVDPIEGWICGVPWSDVRCHTDAHTDARAEARAQAQRPG